MALINKLQTGLSVFYLISLSAIGIFTLKSSYQYSLPIPNLLSALAIALPPLAGVALEILIGIYTSQGQPQVSWTCQVVVAFFVVYQTILGTLAGTYLTASPPGSRDCALREKWKSMFEAKDDKIREIQDTLQCCGFSRTDEWTGSFSEAMSMTCAEQHEHRQPCFDPWRNEEKTIAGLLLGIAVGVFIWMVVIILMVSYAPSNVRYSSIDDDDDAGRRPRRNIYGGWIAREATNETVNPAYHDQTEDRSDEENVEGDSLREEVSRLNRDSRLASEVEGARVRPSPLRRENEIWTSQDGVVAGIL